MEYLVTAAEMKLYDRTTIEKIGIPALVLMERAALGAFEIIKQMWKQKGTEVSEEGVLILAGTGNNGADGLALARLLSEYGCVVDVWCPNGFEKTSEEWAVQFNILKNYPVTVGTNRPNHEYTLIIDAMFGIGLSREVTGRYRDAILAANEMKALKCSLDIPSGVNGDTGAILGVAFRADFTVTFGFLKRGLLFFPGCEYTGAVHKIDIGISERSFNDQAPKMFFYKSKAEHLLPARKAWGNKGTFGKVLLFAGSKNMAGAAVLAAKAAYRAGAGMVKVITPKENRVILQQTVPEALLGSLEELKDSLLWADVLVAGPGIGQSESAKAGLDILIRESSLPILLDADALNLLAKDPKLCATLSEQEREIILTPHVGELSRLMQRSVAELKGDLPAYAETLAKSLHAVVVAKDARTFICREKGAACVNIYGNSGMATAGSGDVLAGVISGLLAQGMSGFDAASVGVYLHAKSGDAVKQERGEHALMAGDLIEKLEK